MLTEALYANATVTLARKRVRADELRQIDFKALSAARNVRRADAMRDAWATGRHPRAMR
jgi:hypothetical protein